MEYKERLRQAIDYAIESEYDAWFIQDRIIDRLKAAKNICLYGVGKYFKDIQGDGRLKKFPSDIILNYVCDNDEKKQGEYFETNISNAKCISFEELKQLEDVVVLITVGNYYEIKEALDKCNIENYSFGDLNRRVYDMHYSKEWFIENKSDILQAYELYDDDKSKEVYTEIICNRIAPHLALKCFNDLKEENEYWSTGLFEIVPENEYIADCGAYIGDSLEKYVELFGNTVGAYYCFELNNEIADVCGKTIEKYQNSNIKLIRAGVSDLNKEIEIIDTGSNMSSTQHSGEKKVKARVVKLDDELHNQKITYIKMDVEGEEVPALKGAENIIKEQSPKLCISAYHLLSDMWRVPILIRSINPKYKFYLRHHTAIVADTDCYAVIK